MWSLTLNGRMYLSGEWGGYVPKNKLQKKHVLRRSWTTCSKVVNHLDVTFNMIGEPTWPSINSLDPFTY